VFTFRTVVAEEEPAVWQLPNRRLKSKKRNLAHVKSLGIACRVICYRVVILIIDYACAGSAEIGWRSDQITAAAADFAI
jgi:hypothetical protein